MKISYNEATAMGCSNLKSDLELCEKEGFDYIEIRMDMLKEYLQHHTVSELADFFANSRLKPHAINALYLYPEFLSDQDEPERCKELLAEFTFGCQIGEAIGSKEYIIVPPLQRDPKGGPFIGNVEETKENCVRILSRLGTIAKKYNIKLCFELVGFERSSVRTVAEADAIIRAVAMENVGFVFDSYNLYLYQGTNEFSALRQVQAEKIFAVHLMSGLNVPAAERGQDKRCFADGGVVDVDDFLQTLKAIGYDGMVSVETFNPDYWCQNREWVIHKAYETTREVLQRNGCI
ncbi:2-keto-myo-inositol isomerase [Lachnospiraceae bacterium PM6-15]|uniref:sugar phosphate isomerase/epimerase family protein n=1 Tax=Ohessyouella blattaphilus TaxID=2949333 RepID=UPI003E2B2081